VETGVLVRALSAERLGRYVMAAGGLRGGLRLYEWNLAVSAAFHEPLSYLEVAMRNAIHHRLAQLAGQDDWWNSGGLVFAPAAVNAIEVALYQAGRRVGSTPGHVVAALPFGFWVSLLSSGGPAAYEVQLWRPALHRAFPHFRGHRRHVHQRLETMRLLRNRIAHHEPIYYRHLAADYGRLLTILGWISVDFAWVGARSRVPALLATKPST
jgi:hypothetical protein